MATWPDSLGFPGTIAIREASNATPQKTHRGFRNIPITTVQKTQITMSWSFSASQHATFKTFIEDTISYTDFFLVDVFSGAGITQQSVKLIEAPQESDDYPQTRVVTKFECYDRIVISAAQVDTNLGV